MSDTREERDDGSVYVRASVFCADPVSWAKKADEAPRVVVTEEDGVTPFMTILQQREPLDNK